MSAQSAPGNASFEDSLDSPLTELGLIRPGGRRDEFRFVRGAKPSLGPGVFCYAVTDFWNRSFSNANTLSFEALNHEPGSPARVFLLEESDMVDLLTALEQTSDGVYRWSETAGLKQLIRSQHLGTDEALECTWNKTFPPSATRIYTMPLADRGKDLPPLSTGHTHRHRPERS